MLRLAFDFIITWRETRTRPNAYRNCPEGSAMSFLRQGRFRKPSPGTYALE